MNLHLKNSYKACVRRLVGTSVLICAALASNSAVALDRIRVGFYPNVYWALPFLVAHEKGWWAEVGLDASYVMYKGGGDLLQGGERNEWDVAGVGAPTGLIAFEKMRSRVIAISNDESEVTALYASKNAAENFFRDPTSFKGKRVAALGNSTGDYVLQACLARYGMLKEQIGFRSAFPGESMQAVTDDSVDAVAIWPPFVFQLERQFGYRQLCNAKQVNAYVPGLLIASGKYVGQNDIQIAKFLAVYFRGWAWARANPKEAAAKLMEFYKTGGAKIELADVQRELVLRPTPDVKGQLKMLEKQGKENRAELAKALARMTVFLKEYGQIRSGLSAEAAIEPSYIKLIVNTPELDAYSQKKN